MIIDHENDKNRKKVIEVLLVQNDIKVWVPVMAMNLYSIGSDGVPRQVKEVKVRTLK